MSGFEDYFSAAGKLSAITTNPSLNKDDSIAGPDLNNNGVRDDLDEYLASLEDGEINKKVIFNAFYAYQATINLKNPTEKDVKKAKLRMSDAIKGLVDAFGPKDAFDRLKIIEQYSINTDVRRKAYDEFEGTSAKSETLPDTPNDQAGGDTKQPDQKPIKNISEAIKRLEDLGEIPKLNKDKDIAGPDENGNGVRDDLDAYVASLPDKEEQKKAAIQYLAAYQYAITIDFENSQEVDDAITKTMDATSCIFERYGADEAMKITKNLETYLFNTRARFEAEQMFDIAQQGKVIESKDKGYCTK